MTVIGNEIKRAASSLVWHTLLIGGLSARS
jgi:hypothetical protein